MLLYEETIQIAEFGRKAYLLEKKVPKYLKMLNWPDTYGRLGIKYKKGGKGGRDPNVISTENAQVSVCFRAKHFVITKKHVM